MPYKINMKMGSGSIRAKGKRIVMIPAGTGIVLSDSDYKAFKASIEIMSELVEVAKTDETPIAIPSATKEPEVGDTEASEVEEAVNAIVIEDEDADEPVVEEKVEGGSVVGEKATITERVFGKRKAVKRSNE